MGRPASRAAQPSAPELAREPGKPAPSRRKRPATAAPDGDALFGVADVVPGLTGTGACETATTLGARVSVSARMTAQRQFVRRAPDDANVTRLIDALIRAGGRLTVIEAATAVGEPQVRMSGYLAQMMRLLNVDGYAVLQIKDDGRMVELNPELLRQQFLAG